MSYSTFSHLLLTKNIHIIIQVTKSLQALVMVKKSLQTVLRSEQETDNRGAKMQVLTSSLRPPTHIVCVCLEPTLHDMLHKILLKPCASSH